MYNNINSVNNSLSFEARLDLSKSLGRNSRMRNIAKLFEEKTSRYADETMYMRKSEFGGISFYREKPKNPEVAYGFTIIKSFEKFIEGLSDDEVAKKLVRVFKSMKVEEMWDKKLMDYIGEESRTKKLLQINSDKVKLFRDKGDDRMVDRFTDLASRNEHRLQTIAENRNLEQERTREILTRIANGDPDFNFNLGIFG